MADTSSTDTDVPESDRNQLIAAIILGLAATLTAIASWQGGVVSGDADVARADGAKALADANFFYGQVSQISAGDQALFVAYAGAAQEGNQDLADYYQTLMRPAMSEAIDWWQVTDEAGTPFDEIEGSPYVIEESDSAEQLQAESDGKGQDAEDADAKGDKYDLSTVLLALTLFFAGVATLFNRRSVEVGLLAVGGVTLVLGAAVFLQGLTL